MIRTDNKLRDSVNLENVLTAHVWQADYGHRMLFTRERYFVFEKMEMFLI